MAPKKSRAETETERKKTNDYYFGKWIFGGADAPTEKLCKRYMVEESSSATKILNTSVSIDTSVIFGFQATKYKIKLLKIDAMITNVGKLEDEIKVLLNNTILNDEQQQELGKIKIAIISLILILKLKYKKTLSIINKIKI